MNLLAYTYYHAPGALLILLLVGCATNPLTGKRELDPNVRNQLLSVAQAEIHGLATDYLQTGKVDYKKDLISGALSQVYTLEGTATPATQASVGAAVATVISDPSLKAAVTSAALNTINAVPAGTTKPVAINGALSALDLALSQLKAPTSSIWKAGEPLSFAREDMRRGMDKGDQGRGKLDKGDQRRGPLSLILRFLGFGK